MRERLLIATHNRLSLWDGNERVIIGEHVGEHTCFFGISWNDTKIFVAEQGDGKDSIFHILDKNLTPVGKLPFGDGIPYPHQIYWWDGKLYVSSGAQDVIWIWDGQRCHPVGWKAVGEPTQHLNSIWCDGENFYVVEHRYEEMPKRIRVLDLKFEHIRCIELAEEIFIRPKGLHNVYIEDGILYTCGSKSLVQYDLITGESSLVPLFVKERYRYVRGLARTKNGFYVGLSRLAARHERGEGDSIVVCLDNDFNMVDTIVLRDAGGITEVRAIDNLDLAHNRIRCPHE